MKKYLKFLLISIFAVVPIIATSLVVVSCSSAFTSTPPVDPEPPTPPIDPTPPVDPEPPTPPVDPEPPTPPVDPEPPTPPVDPTPPEVDPIKHQINLDYLKHVIENNQYGYNPSSFKKTISDYQTNSNQEFLDNIFIDKKITSWNSIKNLIIDANDVKGEILFTFDFGGTHNYHINLNNSNSGLLSDAHYYQKIDDISFGFEVRSDSIVSGRNLPVLDKDEKVIKNAENDINATFTNSGAKFSGRNTQYPYLTSYFAQGTGWLVDYLPSNNPNQDFYEFIIATNQHVGDITAAFHYTGGRDTSFQNGVALDPIRIGTSWTRRRGVGEDRTIDYNNPNSFEDKNKAADLIWFPIDNLSFQRNTWGGANANVPRFFHDNVIKNQSRLDKEDSVAFSTWDHPTSATSTQEKENVLNNFNFYNPLYESKFHFEDINQYWKDQLNNSDDTMTYTNIQPDMVFLKTQFKKSDLIQWWPTLYKSIENNTIDELLLPMTTDIVDPSNKISLYHAGYPHYKGNTDQTTGENSDILERENGNRGIPGTFLRFSKASPNLGHIDFNRWPNNINYDLENRTTANISNYRIRAVTPSPEQEAIDPSTLLMWYDERQTRVYWQKYNSENITQSLEKYIPVKQTNSQLINDFNSMQGLIDLKDRQASEYFASSPNRGMISKTINATKKYNWSSSEYIIPGASGSVIINPKMQIVGIISSSESNLELNNGIRNVIFEGAVNNSNSIISGDKIIANGLTKHLKSLNLKTIIYNKR